MTAIRAEVRYNSKLTEIERRFAIPLVEIAQQLVPGMLERIRRGVSSTGYFAPLGAYSTPTPGGGLFWVPPGRPQPTAAFVVHPKSGAYLGWAGYRTYRDYCAAVGSKPRNFESTGELLSMLKIRVMGPGRVKVAFYGSHTPGEKAPGVAESPRQNSAVAFLASRHEPEPMLTPTRAEIVRVAQQFKSEVGAQVIGESAAAQRIKGLSQKANQLTKRLSAQQLGRR